MPIQTPAKQLVGQEVRGFFGVDLRSDPTQTKQGFVPKSVNADLHSKPGTAIAGPGTHTVSKPSSSPITRLTRFGDTLYAVSGTSVYANGDAVTNNTLNISPASFTSLISYQGLNDIENQTYVANRFSMGRISKGQMFKWGIAAPAQRPFITGALNQEGDLDGLYSFVYTYARKSGNALISESNPSSVSNTFDTGTIAATTTTTTMLSVNVFASDDPQVTHIRLYRTQGDGSTYLFDQEVANADATISTMTLDAALGTAVDETHAPPVQADLAVVHNDRIFIADSTSNRLWWSLKFFPEYFDSFIDIGPHYDRITGLTSIGGVLGVFTERTKYRVIEQLEDVSAVGTDIPFLGATAADFVAVESVSRRGCYSPGAIVNTGAGVIFPSRDGVYVTDFNGPDSSISADIDSIFYGKIVNGISAIDWDYAEQIRASYFKGRYFLSYKGVDRDLIDRMAIYSFETQGWYFYNLNAYELYYDDIDDIFLLGTSGGYIQGIEENVVLSPVSSQGGGGSAGVNSPTSYDIEILTPVLFGDNAYIRKLFQYLKIDANVGINDTLTVSLLIDGTTVHTVSITGNRTRRLLRLPRSAMGHTWQLQFLASSAQRATEIYGGMVSWLPLQSQ